jgi:Zn-dependent protease
MVDMDFLLMIPALLFSIIAHEVAHGYVANYYGDPTAKNAGRLTLNPLPHLELFGSLIVPLVLILTRAPILIGWAKPVPVNPNNLRDPGRHHLYVSLAGVATNLALAVLFTLLYGIYVNIVGPSPKDTLLIMLRYAVVINVILAVFNILPIPPLDGSWVVYHLLPHHLAEAYRRIFPYGFFILILLLMTNVLQSIIIPLYSLIMSFLQALLKIIVL